MLNEAEKNCSRYEQQNKFLKEDIRRLQRSVDRHAEIQNMEYLKNIIIKVRFFLLNLKIIVYSLLWLSTDFFLLVCYLIKWSRKVSSGASNK